MQEDRRQNESIEGTPKGDGTVADEDVKKITGTDSGVEGGQDRSTSTDGRAEEQQPTEGVGAQPDENDRQANVAKTSD
jgi:hypothetical protein